MPGYVNIGARVGAREQWSTPGPRWVPARRSGAACTSPGVSAWRVLELRPARGRDCRGWRRSSEPLHCRRGCANGLSEEAVLLPGWSAHRQHPHLRRDLRPGAAAQGRGPGRSRGDSRHAAAQVPRWRVPHLPAPDHRHPQGEHRQQEPRLSPRSATSGPGSDGSRGAHAQLCQNSQPHRGRSGDRRIRGPRDFRAAGVGNAVVCGGVSGARPAVLHCGAPRTVPIQEG